MVSWYLDISLVARSVLNAAKAKVCSIYFCSYKKFTAKKHSFDIEAALSDNNPVAKELGIKKKLQESWEKRHKLIRHCEQERIVITPQQQQAMHNESKCCKYGFCWCKLSGKRERRWGQDAIQCQQNIVVHMKKLLLWLCSSHIVIKSFLFIILSRI